MKQILLLLVLLAAQQRCDSTSHFQYLQATSQSWVGGVAGAQGTYYNIYLLMKPAGDMVFDSLWVAGKRLPLRVVTTSATDTLQLFANNKITAAMHGAAVTFPASDSARAPVSDSAAAVVGYFFRGTRAYFLIPSFTNLKTVMYQ